MSISSHDYTSAWTAGYNASVAKDNPANPYFADTQSELYCAWLDGVRKHRADAGTLEAFPSEREW